MLKKAKRLSNLSGNAIAALCGVSSRTIRDWQKEKHLMGYDALKKLCRGIDMALPEDVKILPEYWYVKDAGRHGAFRRNELYGNPGTPDGRSKGGKATLEKFRLDPEYAKRTGFITKKEINYPQKTSLLAEFIGIVLGDGSITEYQVKISTNSKTDIQHAYFIKQTVKRLFGVSCKISIEKKNTLGVTISSKNIVDFLCDCGLKRGDKVAQQVQVPSWILKQKTLMKGCLRGLIDTDGSVYFHTHTTKGIMYRHIGLVFTNLSLPLLKAVQYMLLTVGIKAKSDKKRHVSIYDRNEIIKYMKEVGSHNKKHINRFKSYKDSRVLI